MHPAAKHTLTTLLVLGAVGCATVTNPATGRQEYLWIDPSVERSMGQEMAAQVETQFVRSRDTRAQALAERIVQRLALVSDRPGVPYRVQVLRGPEVNAFAIPGGWLYVYEGAVAFAQSEEELAAVLAHEIGHVAAWHHLKQLQADMGYQLFEQVALGHTNQAAWRQATRTGFDLLSRGFSRNDELEADRLALRYLARAGYPPSAVITFLRRLAQQQPEDPNRLGVLFRTHPYLSDRLQAAQAEMAHLRIK